MTENPQRCAQVVSRAINLIYVLSALIYPFMPATSDALLLQLNAPARAVPEVLSTDILAGHQIGQPEHLFKNIDEQMEQVWKTRFGGDESTKKEEEAPTSKRKAKKAAGTNVVAVDSGSKSPEAIALEAKILEQGQVVRGLKESKEPKDVIDVAVTELKRLKAELVLLEKSRNSDAQ